MTSDSLAPAPFGRVLTAMVTPFAADGSVDLEATARVATHLADHGHDGVVVSGTTGESPTTSTEEDGRILRAVVDAVGDRVKVVAGVGTNNTAHSVELAEQAFKIGAHGALLVTPYYNKPTQEGLAAHFEAVADASALPVMLYDIPGRTGLQISEDTYRRVARHERIVAVKDAVGDLYRGVRIMQETGLAFYSGDDVLNLAWLTHGGSGIVSVVGHVAGDQYAAMVRAVEAGDLAGALDVYRRLVPVVDAIMNKAPGAMMAKAAMELLGVIPNRNVRLPLVPADDALVAHLRAELAAAGLLEETRA
ncbi:4-hydroxy-tetrahydrodipicolinate synthase [Nocardioides sp. WL0053]|uniref:4-hydroxy-tetrahydrodipicolinate synthase n=1 Tax=Nocardioides jiangsuensis TaxID=2866161 RepID=A0ABS7RLC2_9ACTN|nr:4-hydroxy-tetrahydrodipicolinate synthase [Nocardioides jiangsuensis]MBY9075857.1 4-hydroxy-tetrahydrodipicolinate synthase [Nocardioides jiangsuensis]